MVEVSIFLGNLFFSFLEGGLREGGRLLSTFRLFLREQAGPGGGYRIMIVMWEAEILTMGGGGGQRLFILIGAGGGGGGEVFWVGRIAPSKKIQTSTIWKDYKYLWQEAPAKIVMGWQTQ